MLGSLRSYGPGNLQFGNLLQLVVPLSEDCISIFAGNLGVSRTAAGPGLLARSP